MTREGARLMAQAYVADPIFPEILLLYALYIRRSLIAALARRVSAKKALWP
jgi:hypothetical protein